MQRPRKHPGGADRSAAYRERRESVTKRVDRKAVEALLAAVESAAAAAAGDPVAKQVKTGTVDGLLRNLAVYFERQGRELGK